MKRIIFLLLGLSAYVLNAFSQSNNNFRDWVTSLTNDSTGLIYAGTSSNGNGIYLSTDLGNHWNHSKMMYGVTSMTLTKRSTIVTFAFGSSFGRYLFRLTNNGSTLDSVTLNFTPASIAASQNGSLCTTTFNQGIFRSTDDGTSWTQIGGGLNASQILSPIAVTNSGIILVSTKNGVMRSTNNGQSWRKVVGIHDSASIKQIIPFTDNKIYAGAYESMGINTNEIYFSSDTGNNWKLLKILKFNLDAMAVDSNGNLYAGNSDGVYRMAANGDTSYAGLGGIAVNGSGVKSLLLYGEKTILAGAWGGVYKSTDTGTSWKLLNDGMVSDTSDGGFTNPLPFGSYISSGLVDKYGNFIAGTDSAGVFRSTDRGKTWIQTSLIVPCIKSVALDSIGNLFAGTLSDGIFESTDNGVSWTPAGYNNLKYNKAFVLCSVDARSPWGGHDTTRYVITNIVYAGTDEGIYFYYDNAGFIMWDPAGNTSDTVRALTSLASRDVFASTVTGNIYQAINGWEPFIYVGKIGARVEALAANSSGELFAAGPNGFFRSTDHGSSWRQNNFGILDTNLICVTVNKIGNVFVGSYTNGDIYKSTDEGEHWNKFITLGYPVRCLFVDAVDNTYAAVASRLFRISATPTSVIRYQNILVKDFSLDQNYPNPFNPTTVISFSLPFKSFVSLKIFDIIGREVAKLVHEELSAGNHTQQWNAEGLPSGVYFYRLSAVPTDGWNGHTERYSQTKKLLYLK